MKTALLIAALLIASPAWAGTVTFTDPATGEVTNTIPLEVGGHFNFRIVMPPLLAGDMPVAAVSVFDDTGQMAVGCHPMDNGMTIAVTSELVVASQPVVTITGRSHSNVDCTGLASEESNAIVVGFTVAAPILSAP
jgi:hypothetical protein